MNTSRITGFFTILATLVLALAACMPTVPITGTNPSTGANPSTGGVITPKWGVQTKTSGCKAIDVRPDPGCTPGAIFNVTKEEVCKSGYSSGVRSVTDSVKNQVYAEYGISSHNPGEYEVDHFVSLELGGSNDISNLWPEPAAPKPGFHEKDKVENYLHDQVCSGAMTLDEARLKIATNWLDVYNQMPK
jgi:hypothetical protein